MKRITGEKKGGEREDVCFTCLWGGGVKDRKRAALCFLWKTVASDVSLLLSILFCHDTQSYTAACGHSSLIQ